MASSGSWFFASGYNLGDIPMVTPLSLYLFAATMLFLAAGVGWLRRIELRDALADGRAALLGALSVFAASTVLFALSRPVTAPGLWGYAGSVALLVSPLGATMSLRSRGRRSIPRALLVSVFALAGVALWLTVNLRGPRGGWRLVDIALVLPAVAIAVASAACLGWWTKRRAVEEAPVAGGR